MGRKHLLESALSEITYFFDSLDTWAFTTTAFDKLVFQHSFKWKMPSKKGGKYLFTYLEKKGLMFSHEITTSDNSIRTIYSWRTQDEYSVISGLHKNAYFGFYTALHLHGLTLQIPKTIYLNAEHSPPWSNSNDHNNLTQESIDSAFSGEQRKSRNTFSFHDKRIILTTGKHTNRLGVVKHFSSTQHYHITDIERTLIDCIVRPVYAGGVTEVMEAFRQAKSKLNVPKLLTYLNEMNFIYPYHQALGFYLENAGFNEAILAQIKYDTQFKFYLTYNIRNKRFSDRWNLYYPAGLI